MKLKNRHRLKSKDTKILLEEIERKYNCNLLDKITYIETGQVDGFQVFLVDDEVSFVSFEDKIIFTLHGINKFKPKSNYVIVDMGAVKFVANGADVMAPGIIEADPIIEKGDSVWVCDERNHKPLAVGFSTMSGEDMISKKAGKAVRVVHHIGDKIWIFPAKSL